MSKEAKKQSIQKLILINILLLLIAVGYTLIVKYVDVQAIGPQLSKVGLGTINKSYWDLIGYNELWYKVTKYLGVVPFLIVAYYGLQGLLQVIQKKSILKVDKKILSLGGFYVLVGATYVLFEKLIINYRPVLEDGKLEASFPSSHTMLAVCICLTSLLISKYYLKNEKIRKCFDIGTVILMLVLVIGRLLSGVHWFSDILGGVIISLFLVSIYYTLINIFKDEKKSQ